MGKRKLHGHSYYQCDWTAFPMKNSNCYMPTWNADKLIKKGSYCNWESVLAHATYLDVPELERVREYVKTQMGGTIHATEAPHFTDLLQFNGTMNVTQFHEACCKQLNDVFAVKINEAGHTFEILVGNTDFSTYLKHSFPDAKPSTFQFIRKGKHKERELCVFYYPRNNGQDLNVFASNLFKMQIYGEVLMLQCTKESSFMPRERYVNYTLEEFNDNFLRKKKKVDSMKPTDYEGVKLKMQESLSAYEKQASLSSQVPEDLVKVGKVPKMNGRQLAALVKHQRQEEV